MKKITLDGNTAAASIAYKLSEIASIYPITPSSGMAEYCDELASKNIKNIFGSIPKVVEMQSEAGAAGTMHGSLSGGALCTTFTASQGLLLMIPNMYKIAGELLPNVIHVSARALATHALSIFGDQSDVMAVRQTGYALLCSGSVQEAQDFALISHIATLKSSIPFLHFFDGFKTSHEINTIESIEDETIKTLIPYEKINEFKKRGMNSAHPHQQGTAQNPDIYFQNREACNKFYASVPGIVAQTFNDFYKLTGRKYKLFDYFGDKNAERVIVIMGSGANTCSSTASYLNKKYNEKVGIISVRLYRPFDAKALLSVLPKTVKAIAVLDRTKEPGADGEPLYKDIVCALANAGKNEIKVVGGRYGVGAKEFTPTMATAVFDNLKTKNPKNNFTVGIVDDVTNLSLKPKREIFINENITACKFYGYGGDGTVSANKSSIKIICDNSKLFGQANFEYDSKKSGNATISHIRFGKQKINESYFLDYIDLVAVHNETYLTKFNLTKGLKKNGTLLLNTRYNIKQLDKLIPLEMKQYIYKNNISVYSINAYAIAAEIGLGDKINLIMQTAFFKLQNIIDFKLAVREIKKMAEYAYGKKGPEILQRNFKAVDAATDKLIKLEIPASWAEDNKNLIAKQKVSKNSYFTNYIDPIQKLEGNNLPVSLFAPNGCVPTNTSCLEKRGIAKLLPSWKSENCIQCNMCAFVCPHAAIRPHLIKENDLKKTPKDLQILTATAEKNKKYIMQLNPLDCTGCGVCANVCPSAKKALVMTQNTEIIEAEIKNYNYLEKIPTTNSDIFKDNSIKGCAYKKPYFEFSGACGGCGETPYIKVLTQLFGERMVIANATGCSSIYGGSSPTCPYSKDENGRGPAWGNSLFEDNAEFGLGIKLGLEVKENKLKELLKELLKAKISPALKKQLTEYLKQEKHTNLNEANNLIAEIKKLTKTKNLKPIATEILNYSDSFITNSVWVIGGDGWAYDIGYGGLDHVFASKENINILVLDTQVYSNTGGQASKATPTGAVAKFAAGGKRTKRKDLGLIATINKDVYVAQVSMGANMSQLITAFKEAESYNGVSIIIAYAPCINQGLKMENSQLQMKKAVESGYWNLWRYNPMKLTNNENPFTLDSVPTKDYIDFIKTETRYSMLENAKPEIAKRLFAEAKAEAILDYENLKKLASVQKPNKS